MIRKTSSGATFDNICMELLNHCFFELLSASERYYMHVFFKELMYIYIYIYIHTYICICCIQAKPRGVKTGGVVALEVALKEMKLKQCRIREEEALTEEELRKKTLSAELDLIEIQIIELEGKQDLAKKRAAGGGKRKQQRCEEKASAEAGLKAAKLEAAEDEPEAEIEGAVEQAELAEAAEVEMQELTEAAVAQAKPKSKGCYAELAEAAEIGDAAAEVARVRVEKRNRENAKNGCLGAAHGKKGGRPKKQHSELDKAISDMSSRIIHRPKMRKGSKGGTFQAPSLAAQMHFCKDHKVISNHIAEKNFSEIEYWKWQAERTGVSIKLLHGF